MLKVYYIYIHTFSNNTKYVEKGKDRRAYSFYNRNKYWNNLHAKYGKPRVHIIKSNMAEQDAFFLEKALIEVLHEAGITLCNITIGGEGLSGMTGDKAFWFGKKRSTDTCSKISLKLSGDNHPNYGIKLSTSTKIKIGLKHKGKVVSAKTVEKLRIAGVNKGISGTKNPAYSSTVHTFTHQDYGTIEATQYELYTRFRLTKSAVCCVVSGKRNSHKGWRIST
jgi:hypothetical protein